MVSGLKRWFLAILEEIAILSWRKRRLKRAPIKTMKLFERDSENIVQVHMFTFNVTRKCSSDL